MVLPSGLTDRLIHVPSSVSIFTALRGPGAFSTSQGSFFFFSSESSPLGSSRLGEG